MLQCFNVTKSDFTVVEGKSVLYFLDKIIHKQPLCYVGRQGSKSKQIMHRCHCQIKLNDNSVVDYTEWDKFLSDGAPESGSGGCFWFRNIP